MDRKKQIPHGSFSQTKNGRSKAVCEICKKEFAVRRILLFKNKILCKRCLNKMEKTN